MLKNESACCDFIHKYKAKTSCQSVNQIELGLNRQSSLYSSFSRFR